MDRKRYADDSDYVHDPQLIKKIRKCIGRGKTHLVDKRHTMYFRDDMASYYHAINNLMMRFKKTATITDKFLVWEFPGPEPIVSLPKLIIVRLRRYVEGNEPNRVEVLFKENL